MAVVEKQVEQYAWFGKNSGDTTHPVGQMSNNSAGVVREWWCHTATSYWFIAERNTVTDEILRTYPASEVFKDRRDFPARPAAGKDENR